MARLFLAIELPEDLRLRLARLGAEVPGGRAPKAAQVHLTLRFAEAVDETLGRRWSAALSDAASATLRPLHLTLRGVGAFPRRGDPRVVWSGLDPNPELLELQARVEAASVAAGLPPEPRPFRPHVTLARLRHSDGRAVKRWLDAHEGFGAPPFRAAELVLFESELLPGGARHRRLEAWALGPDEGPGEPGTDPR